MTGDDATIRLDHASRLVCSRCGGAMTRQDGAAVCAACDVRVAVPAERTFGRFTLQRELGQGGFGAVWLAWDPQTSRRVALKILRDPDAEMLARFEREARTAANLSHANIAAVFDVGAVEGRHYIAFQYVEGETLAKLRLTPHEAVDAVRDAARAADYAHRQGVIHRDLKPQNLMREPEGRLFVLDFGLARPIRTDSTITAEGDITGTPAYMAPEQALSRPVSERTDVYGLGATLYQLVTGGPPYTGKNSLDVLQKVLTEDPIEPRRVNRGLDRDIETIILKAMERDPARRYASAGDLADDLARARAGEPIRAHPPSLLYRLRKRAAKRKGVLAAAALLGAVLAAGVPLWWRARAEQRHAERALDLWGSIAQTVTDAEVYARLGDVGTSRRKLDEGIAACRAHLAQEELPQARYFLGRLLHAQGRGEEAERELTRAIELSPALGEAYFERGLVRVEAYESRLRQVTLREKIERGGDIGDIGGIEARNPELAALRDAAARDLEFPVGRSSYFRSVDALYGRAELARLRSDGDAAREGLSAVVKAEPAYAPAAVSLARMEFQLEAFDLAVVRADEAIAIHAGLAPAYHIRSEARFWLGESSGARDEASLEACFADIERAIEIGPATPDMTYHRANVLWRLAQIDAAAGRDPHPGIDRAIADADRLLAAEPPLVEAYAVRALALIERGRAMSARGRSPAECFARAEADSTRLLDLIPRSMAGLANRGLARLLLAEHKLGDGTLRRADVEGAIEDLTIVIERGRAHGTVYANRAAATLLLGDLAASPAELYRRAEADATRAVEMIGDDSSYVTRGIARTRLARTGADTIDAAVRDFERVLEKSPNEPSALLNLIEALFVRSERTGIEDLRRAAAMGDLGVERAPRDARILGVAGAAHRQLAHTTVVQGGDPGDGYDRAIELMTRALDAAPDLVAARINRANALTERGLWGASRGADPSADLRRAVGDYEAAVRQVPGHPLAEFGLAVTCRHFGEVEAVRDPAASRVWFDRSIGGFTRALDGFPDTATLRTNRANSYFDRARLGDMRQPKEQADLASARVDLDAALAARDGDATALKLRGVVLYCLGDFAGALRDLERVPPDDDVRRVMDSCRELMGEEF